MCVATFWGDEIGSVDCKAKNECEDSNTNASNIQHCKAARIKFAMLPGELPVQERTSVWTAARLALISLCVAVNVFFSRSNGTLKRPAIYHAIQIEE